MSQRSMEMKVGALMALSVLLLIGFVFVMGGLTLQPTYRVLVEFENPAGLQSGSPIRIAGARVGRIAAIEFRGGELDAKGQAVPPIRVVANIEARYRKAIHDDATFFITAQGVLGEMHLAIEPGTVSRPLLPPDSVVRGISPPRIDQLLGEGYDIMHRSYQGLVGREKQLGETLDGVHQTFGATGRLLTAHEKDVSRLIARADALATQAEETLAAARYQYVDGPRIERILGRLDHITAVLDQNLDPMLTDARGVLGDGRAITQVLAEKEQLDTIRAASRETRALLGSAGRMAADAETILGKVKSGRGTAGALVMDETLYDDLQELIRDLKRNPWKLIWKE
jgi:phospholipid/cholesterol/gamma-HCH transport system substrate-binding protein